MNRVIQSHQPAVAELCRQFGVERLEVFGSAARDDFDSRRSDLDFIVRFVPPHVPGYADRYLAFAEALEGLFKRPVDLLTERSLRNPILKTAIAADRFIVYGG
jgi:predicted nucleotidyltransferase